MEQLDLDEDAADASDRCRPRLHRRRCRDVPEKELLEIGAFDEDTVKELRSRARSVLTRRAIKREENLRLADKSLLELPGLDGHKASVLLTAGVLKR